MSSADQTEAKLLGEGTLAGGTYSQSHPKVTESETLVVEPAFKALKRNLHIF